MLKMKKLSRLIGNAADNMKAWLRDIKGKASAAIGGNRNEGKKRSKK